jgi:hypothetical protein
VDEAFMTWNRSENELYELFQTMARCQQPFLSLRFSISKKVNYLEAKLGHSYGMIDNKVNHQSLDYPFSFIPQRNDPLHKKIFLLQTALNRAIECCSTEYSYRDEQDYLKIMFDKYSIPFDSIVQYMTNLNYRNFDYNIYQYGHRDRYSSYRHTIQCIKDKPEKKREDILYLNCPLKGQQLMEFKQDFQCLLEQWANQKLDSKKINIEIVSRPNYPGNTK